MPQTYNASPSASEAEDNYSDSPSEERSEEATGETALLPKSFLQGKELTPGTVCKIKIERVLDDQVEVSYVPHESEEEAEPEPAMPPDSEMNEMMG